MSDYENRIAAHNQAANQAAANEQLHTAEVTRLGLELGAFLRKSGVMPLPVFYEETYREKYFEPRTGLIGRLLDPIEKERVATRDVQITEGWVVSDNGWHDEVGFYTRSGRVLTVEPRVSWLGRMTESKIYLSSEDSRIVPSYALQTLLSEQLTRDVAEMVKNKGHQHYFDAAHTSR